MEKGALLACEPRCAIRFFGCRYEAKPVRNDGRHPRHVHLGPDVLVLRCWSRNGRAQPTPEDVYCVVSVSSRSGSSSWLPYAPNADDSPFWSNRTGRRDDNGESKPPTRSMVHSAWPRASNAAGAVLIVESVVVARLRVRRSRSGVQGVSTVGGVFPLRGGLARQSGEHPAGGDQALRWSTG